MLGTLPLNEPLTVLAAQGPSWWDRIWFREAASTFAPSSDGIYYFIFFVSAVFFVLLVALTAYWGWSYRRSKVGEVAPVSASHNTALELSWSITPAILMAVMFFWGFHAYMKKLVAPVDSTEVYVTAYQWGWDFTYPDGGGTSQIASKMLEQNDDGTYRREIGLAGGESAPIIGVPIDTPVKMIMTSRDVIHSFYVPAFRVKRDVFPNRYTTLWFEATGEPTHYFDEDDNALVPFNADSPGYYLFCAEYCGDQHSQMAGRIAVLTDADYTAWRRSELDTSGIPLIELGEQLHKTKGCVQCHSVDGSRKIGPSWKGVYGDTDHIPGWNPPPGSDAEPGVVGDDYLRQAILEPGAYITPGYPNQMVSYQGQLTERELRAIILYIKSLSDDPQLAEEAVEASQAEIEAQEEGGEGEAGGEGDEGGAGATDAQPDADAMTPDAA